MRSAILIGATGACHEKATPPPEPPPRQGIEMVSQGTLPRRELRYQLARGVRTQVELELDAEVVAPGLARPMPTAITVLELGADDVLPDGAAQVRTTILRASARARPGADASLEVASAQGMMLSGVAITGTLTPRGRILEARLEGGAGLPAKTAEGIRALVAQSEELAMPLPEPAVGVGAIWRIRRDTTQLGIKLETITEIEVTAIEGTASAAPASGVSRAIGGPRVSYAMRTQVRGDDQHTAIEGVEVDVRNVRGSGAGRGVIDLGRMAMFGEQSLELGFDIAAMKESGSVTMRTTRRLKPVAGAGYGEQSAP